MVQRELGIKMSNALNLQEIEQEEAFNLCKFFIRSQKNILLLGRRGIGKTEICFQAIKDCGFNANYINLSVIDRSDLIGFPNMFEGGDTINFKAPYYIPFLDNGKLAKNVFIFDEVDKCSPEITAPLLELLLYKKLNGRSIDVVSCILTGNLPNEGAFSNQISTALLDRAAKYVLSFDLSKWIEWARLHQIHELVVGFLMKHPDLACGEIDDVSYASPSPRGWTLVSDALLKARDLKIIDIETTAQIIAGFVGIEAATKFKIWFEFYRKFDVPVASLIEHGKMTLNYAMLETTEKMVFVIAACQHAKMKTLEGKSKIKFPFLENLCRFFESHAVDSEIKVVALNNAFTFDLIAANKLYSCKSFFDLFSKMNESFGIR